MTVSVIFTGKKFVGKPNETFTAQKFYEALGFKFKEFCYCTSTRTRTFNLPDSSKAVSRDDKQKVFLFGKRRRESDNKEQLAFLTPFLGGPGGVEATIWEEDEVDVLAEWIYHKIQENRS